jgi:hypothetical protein
MVEMGRTWLGWLSNAAARETAGAAAKAMVQRELGAADRTVELLQAVLDLKHPRANARGT